MLSQPKMAAVGEIPVIGDLEIPGCGLGELRFQIDGSRIRGRPMEHDKRLTRPETLGCPFPRCQVSARSSVVMQKFLQLLNRQLALKQLGVSAANQN